jgi:hypothetical protein
MEKPRIQQCHDVAKNAQRMALLDSWFLHGGWLHRRAVCLRTLSLGLRRGTLFHRSCHTGLCLRLERPSLLSCVLRNLFRQCGSGKGQKGLHRGA